MPCTSVCGAYFHLPVLFCKKRIAFANFAVTKTETMKSVLKLIVAALTVASCSSFFDSRGEVVDVEGSVPHDMIVLGDKLEDPYSVTNMTKAFESLYPTKAGRTYLEPTDYYVRFLPEGEAELESLMASGMVLLDHPVDYEILRDGDYYHDPSLDEDRITWQYGLVPKGQDFPADIRYEVLDECYLPDHDAGTKADGVDWEQVERLSYELTGNAGMLRDATKGSSSGKPSGRISIIDPAYDDEPFGVRGVTVLAVSFVKFCTTTTDDEGYYSMKKTFNSDVRYRLVFKNEKGFAIGFNKILVPASTSTLGKHGPDGVSMVVSGKSDGKLFQRCVVNNAAYDWWVSCAAKTPHVKTPPNNLRLWIFQSIGSSSAIMMQQGCMVDDSAIGDILGDMAWLVKMFLPDITIGLKGCRDDYASIYALAVHECAHASHFTAVGQKWWDVLSDFVLKSYVTSGMKLYGTGMEKNHGYCEIAEMWAYAVQAMMFHERYVGSDLVFGTSYWFFPQILLYLEERGLTRYKVFQAMTSDVTDRDLFQAKLLSLYPEYKSIIKQAFERYDY